MSTRPLADEIRPQSLDEVVGQRHLIGPGGVLRRLIDAGTSANMIFYGPSGTGKTTIANIIANKTNKTLYRLNATTASLQDVKDIIASVGTLMAPGGILLYLDEIQYFNKKQQQSLLEFMENGSITLIASTTENPFFYVYNALLSRSLGEKNQEAANRAAAVETADKLRNCTVKITAKGGANGKLFGAITGKEISEALMAQFGLDVGKQKIVLDEPIKAFGSYEIRAKLGYEVSGKFTVTVAEE